MSKREKKDILFVLQFFYPEYVSSATLPYDTAKKLTEEGYSVDVLCGMPKEYSDSENVPKRETVDGIGIRRVNYWQLDRKKTLGRLLNYFSFTFAIFMRLFSMRKYRSVVVYSNPPLLPFVAAMASALFGCKLVFVAYDLYPEIGVRSGAMSEGGMISRLMRYINKKVYKRAAGVVALSSEMKEYIAKNRPIDKEKIHVIPNWFADSYDGSERKEDNAFADVVKDRLVVSYFGNMGIAQDMQTLLDAMICLKDDPRVCFLIAGHGSKMGGVRQTIAEHNIQNAYVYDFLKGKAYLDALKASDCAVVSLEKGLTGLCVPSKTYGYMMQGLALLAIVGPSDIARDAQSGAGICVENGSGEALAEKIRALCDDPATLGSMKQKCRQLYLANYKTEICTAKYVDLMRENILGEKA